MFRKILAVAALVGTFATVSLTARPAHAWGAVGHKTVARIAWDNLKPETRAKVIAILQAAPADSDIATMRPTGMSKDDADRAWFETVATWPDVIKSQRTDADKTRRAKYNHSNWHYYDTYIEQDATSGAWKIRTDIPEDAESSLSQLPLLTTQFATVTTAPGDRAVALAWIEHLIGDFHQPLHNVGRVTATEPKGDQGGNLVKLEAQPAPGRQYPASLHSYWDDLPDTAFPATSGEKDEDRLGRIAAAAEQALPKTLFDLEGIVNLGDYKEWNAEGVQNSEAYVYTPTVKPNQMPDAAYAAQAKQVALVGMAKAGYRLAATIEAALK